MNVKTKLSLCSVALVSSLLIGCATGYHPEGLSGGFKEYQVNSDIYAIGFSGNGYTSSGTAYEYTLRRAAELTLEKGYKYFVIKKSASDVSRSSYTTPIQSRTTSNYNAHAFGNFGSVDGESNTTITGGNTYITERPTTGILIQMLRQNNHGALDAAIILRNYAPKNPK